MTSFLLNLLPLTWTLRSNSHRVFCSPCVAAPRKALICWAITVQQHVLLVVAKFSTLVFMRRHRCYTTDLFLLICFIVSEYVSFFSWWNSRGREILSLPSINNCSVSSYLIKKSFRYCLDVESGACCILMTQCPILWTLLNASLL